MIQSQLLQSGNDRNLFVIDSNVLELDDQNYVLLMIDEQNWKNRIPLLKKMEEKMNLKIKVHQM
jgi:hypothetical protein